jgi:hypothetical protein
MSSKDGSYSNKLAPFAVAKTMTSSSLCAGIVYDTFAGCTPREKTNAMNVADPVLPPTRIGFFITAHNIQTDEQFMHDEAVSTLSDWYLHFRDRPIFACVDNEKRVDYPALSRPSYGDVPWTRTRFHYGPDMDWDIIVTLAFNSAPAIDRDFVNMIVISPPVPNSLEAHAAICTTSFDKTTCAIRNMCIHHASSPMLGFSRADDDYAIASTSKPTRHGVMVHGEDKQNGPRNSVKAHLYGSFTSFKPETSAGCTILPQILKQASFILPCIQDDDDYCEYTILQPHRFAYIVQIKNVGGGWTILASVNLVASAKAVFRMFGRGSSEPQNIKLSNGTLNFALRSEPPDCTLTRMYNTRNLSRLIDDAYEKAANGHDLRLTNLLDESIDIDDAVIAELKPHPDLWMMFNAYAGTKLFEGYLKALCQEAVYGDEVKRGNAFIEIYRKACQTTTTATSSDVVIFSKTMFDICMGMATVLVSNKLLVESDVLDTRLSLDSSAWGKDDIDIDADKILTFLQRSCMGTAPKTWFASAYPHFIKKPLLIVQTMLTKTSAFRAYMPGMLGDSCSEISRYIIDSMFVIDKTIAVAQHSASNAFNRNKEQKFILTVALFIFKTAAQGGFHVSDDDTVKRIQELHKSIQNVSKLNAAAAAASQKKKIGPDVVADIAKRHAEIMARVKSADKVYASFVDAKGDPRIASYTAQILENAAAEIDGETTALHAIIDTAPRSKHEKIANATENNKSAADEDKMLDLVIKNREATIVASKEIRSAFDSQLSSYTAQLEKAKKFIDAGEKGDAATIAKNKPSVDSATTEKKRLETSIQQLGENIASATAPLESLSAMQTADANRRVLIAETIAHNNKIIAGASGKPMVWPPAAVI